MRVACRTCARLNHCHAVTAQMLRTHDYCPDWDTGSAAVISSRLEVSKDFGVTALAHAKPHQPNKRIYLKRKRRTTKRL